MIDLTPPSTLRRACQFVALFLGALTCISAGLTPAHAVVELNITQGNIQPMPIAIPDFASDGSIDAKSAQEISDVVSNDLKSSGLFLPIDPAAFIEKGLDVARAPRFEDWRPINAQALVVGRIGNSDGKLRAEFRLWDVLSGKQLAGEQFFTRVREARRVGHIIADVIYERITGEKGYFDTRVVFVDESGPKDKRVKRLAIMDQDGYNVRLLTTGKDLVLTPRFSPSTQEITYMSFAGDDPKVYLLNIETGQKEIVGTFPGMTFAPRFSPDGQRIVMSLEQGGAANIYAMDLRSRSTRPAHQQPGDQHLALLRAGRAPDRVPKRPRRVAADLRDERQWLESAPHQLRRRQLFDPGVVAAGRSHCLHQAGWRPIPHRRDEAGRLGRARFDRGIPQRGAHLGAEWPGTDVLPGIARRQWRSEALFHRPHGL